MTVVTVLQEVDGTDLIFEPGQVIGTLERDGKKYEPYDVISNEPKEPAV